MLHLQENPPERESRMNRLFIIALVLFTLAGPMLGKASADWDPGGGGYSGYYEPPAADPGPQDWTPFYYGW